MIVRIVGVGMALLGLASGAAQAQYYPRHGYGYDEEYGRPPPGGQCDAFVRTPYGPRRVVCPMGRPRPVGYECACPPRDGYGPTAHGHVVP